MKTKEKLMQEIAVCREQMKQVESQEEEDKIVREMDELYYELWDLGV